MSDLKKGDLVRFKPEWCLPQHAAVVYVCYDAPEKGRIGVRLQGWESMNFPNTEVVQTSMLIKVNPMRTTDDYQSLIVSQVYSRTREQLIDWLLWNDPHGVYTDSDCQAEDYPPITLEIARMLVVKAITGE
jgi:hypothetical protein